MSWSHSTLVSAVLARNPRTDSSTLVGQNVEAAAHAFVARYNFPQLEVISSSLAMVAEQDYSELPSDFKVLDGEKSVFFDVADKGRVIKLRDREQFFVDHPRPSDTDSGEPKEATLWANKLLWFPVPDSTYSYELHYHKLHPTFDGTEGNTAHYLGSKCDRAIMALAIAFTYEDFQEYTDSQYWYQIAEREIAEAVGSGYGGIVQISSAPLYS